MLKKKNLLRIMIAEDGFLLFSAALFLFCLFLWFMYYVVYSWLKDERQSRREQGVV